jgi:hypothetical protein
MQRCSYFFFFDFDFFAFIFFFLALMAFFAAAFFAAATGGMLSARDIAGTLGGFGAADCANAIVDAAAMMIAVRTDFLIIRTFLPVQFLTRAVWAGLLEESKTEGLAAAPDHNVSCGSAP